MVCPRCKTPALAAAAFCPFCGTTLRRGGEYAAHYAAGKPRGRRPGAQFYLYILALLLALAVFLRILLSAPYRLAACPADPESPRAAFSAPADEPGPFADANGAYAVSMTLSAAESADAELLAAAEALRGRQLPCTIVLDVDGAGSGTLRVEHAFFPSDTIAVSPLPDEDGASAVALFGFLDVGTIRVSAVCVYKDAGVSGFLWLDNAQTHIEFLYGG